MNKLKLSILSLFLVITISVVSVYLFNENGKSIITSGNALDFKTVIIDAGHGGLPNTIMAIFFDTAQPHCVGAKS